MSSGLYRNRGGFLILVESCPAYFLLFPERDVMSPAFQFTTLVWCVGNIGVNDLDFADDAIICSKSLEVTEIIPEVLNKEWKDLLGGLVSEVSCDTNTEIRERFTHLINVIPDNDSSCCDVNDRTNELACHRTHSIGNICGGIKKIYTTSEDICLPLHLVALRQDTKQLPEKSELKPLVVCSLSSSRQPHLKTPASSQRALREAARSPNANSRHFH